MKTIISIIEVVMYNLFPATLAAPVTIILKEIIPLLGFALKLAGLFVMVWVQKIYATTFRKLQQAKLLQIS